MPDLEDAEVELDAMTGIENSWTGRVLARLVRAVRFSHARAAVQATRIQELEDRVTALENPQP